MRATNSAFDRASKGTAGVPRSTQPQNAAAHSGLFSAHSKTRSPGDNPRRSSSAAKALALAASSA